LAAGGWYFQSFMGGMSQGLPQGVEATQTTLLEDSGRATRKLKTDTHFRRYCWLESLARRIGGVFLSCKGCTHRNFQPKRGVI